MPVIKVERKHSLGRDEALKRAQALVSDLAAKLNAKIEWAGNDATFNGTGFKGEAKVADDSIAVKVDLNLMLSPMKSKIESKITSALEEKFA